MGSGPPERQAARAGFPVVTPGNPTWHGIPEDDGVRILHGLRAYADAGLDAVHADRLGPGVRGFLGFCRTEALPQLTG
ncbi:hypothetical protein ACFPA8_18970 [Streptomyces ovatisporus]|uniref:Uncharacterized protein n=1 Tax=Streptomyces ovatisporus TaxID=1128682 RepID=A0ABV9AA92_9ACTN